MSRNKNILQPPGQLDFFPVVDEGIENHGLMTTILKLIPFANSIVLGNVKDYLSQYGGTPEQAIGAIMSENAQDAKSR